jgi:hypothetical protein
VNSARRGGFSTTTIVEKFRARRSARRVRRATAELPLALTDARELIDQLRLLSISSDAPDRSWRDQRLVEAERTLRSAAVLETSDPVEALAFTRMAANLAKHALRVAGADTKR